MRMKAVPSSAVDIIPYTSVQDQIQAFQTEQEAKRKHFKSPNNELLLAKTSIEMEKLSDEIIKNCTNRSKKKLS